MLLIVIKGARTSIQVTVAVALPALPARSVKVNVKPPFATNVCPVALSPV